MKRILKTRYPKSQGDGGHCHTVSSRVPNIDAAGSAHQPTRGGRHRSDSEVDRKHQQSLTQQRYSTHITPVHVAPKTFCPQEQNQNSASCIGGQLDPTVGRPGAPFALSGGPRRRHTVDTPSVSRLEQEHSDRKQMKKIRFESDIIQKRELCTNRDHQEQPVQIKLSASKVLEKHTVTSVASPSPDINPEAASRSSSLSPSQQKDIFGKQRKRVAHRTNEEIKSHRQGHKVSRPVGSTSAQPPPSKRPRVCSTSSKDIRADLLKRMTKK